MLRKHAANLLTSALDDYRLPVVNLEPIIKQGQVSALKSKFKESFKKTL